MTPDRSLAVLLETVQAGARGAGVKLADAWACAVAVAVGGAQSGAAVARLLGVSTASGKRLMRAFHAALGAAGAAGSPVSPPALDQAPRRGPEGPPVSPPPAHQRAPSVGGKGGGMPLSIPPRDSETDWTKAGQDQGKQLTGEPPAGPFAHLEHPPEHARAAAFAWLTRRGLSPEAARCCMGIIGERWLLYRGSIRSPSSWCMTVAKSAANERFGLGGTGAGGAAGRLLALR